MTEILCKWINDSNKFGERIEADEFPSKFSNGYLFGQILHQYGLQPDFGQFSKASTSEAKLNNFMRLEPTFRQLNISFNSNMAHAIMTEKQGASTRLMYQIFVALHRKEKMHSTSQSIESVRSEGKFKLEQIESSLFQEHLKLQTPRQVDLNFEELIKKFKGRHEKYKALLIKERIEEEEKLQQTRKEACQKALDKSRGIRDAQRQLYARLRPVEILPDKPTKGTKSFRSHSSRQKAIAEEVKRSIDIFEETQKTLVQATPFQRPRPATTGSVTSLTLATSGDGQTAASSSDEYLALIHQRVTDDAIARKEREKRRRKVLIDQMRSLQEQEESRRGEMLVNRLMRQCQQERRIATQLMQIRKEKDVIRRNRVAQLQQYEERRLKEFEDALNREAILAQQKEEEKKIQLRQAKELHHKLQSKKAEERYEKHYALCWDILLQVLDLSTRIGEYKELAQGLVPAKVVRNWKVMLINGNPLYEDQPEQPDIKVVDVNPRMALLNDNDFWEYRNIMGEWECKEEVRIMFPSCGNHVLSHVVYHLHELLSPAQPCRPVSSLPNFSLKACCIGKPFSGKTTILKKISKVHKLIILLPDQLVQKAVNAYLKEKNELDMLRPGNSFNLGESTEVTDDNNSPKPFIEVQPSSTTDVSLADKSMDSIPVPPSKVDSDKDTCDETRSADDTPTPAMGEPIEKQESVIMSGGQFSPLASLGQVAECAMLNGQAVDDVTIVDIILHELKALPEKSGWVIESFPTTLNQAQLLDKALSGFEPPAPPPKLATMLAGVQGHYLLIPKPIPSTLPKPPQSGFDVVLYFDVKSDEIFKRALYDSGEDEETSVDYQPIDTKKNQIQNRLLAFEDNWVLLETWFSQFDNLVAIDASGNEATTQKLVTSKIKELKKEQPTKSRRTSPPKQVIDKKVLEADLQVMAAKSTSEQMVTASATTASVTSNSSATVALTAADQSGINASTPGDDGKKSPEPGSPDWVYADLPISEEMVKALTPKWSAIECAYIKAVKHVFQLIRDEQETHCYYFYDRRMEIISYLKKPDLKQECLSQWQTNYNAIPSNMRTETVMIAEQHQCVDDLCATLWDICDRRRDDAENERVRIMEDNWTDDHSGMIVNHCILLMQCEFNKFQDTVQLLNEYYYSFDDPVPPPVPDKNIKLPLIELPDKEPQKLPASAVGSQTSIEQHDDNKDDSITDDLYMSALAAATAASGTESRDSRLTAAPKQQALEKKLEKKVTLIPRAMPPPETEEKGKKKAHTESPTQVLEGIELDEVLLNHVIKIANKYMTNVIDALVKKHSITVEPMVTDTTASAAAEKEKVDDKGKGGKADPKKGKDKGDKKSNVNLQKATSSKKVDRLSPCKSPIEDPSKSQISVPEVPAGAAEKAKSKQELSRNEHFAAVKHEEQETKARLEMIKSYAIEKIQHIKKTADKMYAEMGEWIEMSYKQECESVSHLAEVLKQAIENEQPLLQEIKMPCKELQIDMSVLMMELPTPPRPETPNEPPSYDQFTVVQLIALHQQLRSIAPSGVVMYKILVDTVYSLSHTSYGSDDLPDSWTDLTPKQMDELLQLIYPEASEYVDWHTLLVTLAQPYPIPSTQDLLNALERYRTISNGDVLISRDQYDKVELWLTTSISSSVNLPQVTYERNSYLKHVLFDMFVDSDDKLDYLKMLLYFSADHDPKSGLFKAMSLLCGSEVDPNNTEEDSEFSVELVCKLLVSGLDQQYEADLLQEIQDIFTELKPTDNQKISINLLLSHPVMAQKLNNCSRFLLPDLTPHYHRCASPTVDQSSDSASH